MEIWEVGDCDSEWGKWEVEESICQKFGFLQSDSSFVALKTRPSYFYTGNYRCIVMDKLFFPQYY